MSDCSSLDELLAGVRQDVEEPDAQANEPPNVVISDDIIEIACLICTNCHRAEFPLCPEHGPFRTPFASDNDTIIYDTEATTPEGKRRVLVCSKCLVCERSTNESFEWRELCGSCGATRPQSVFLRMRFSVAAHCDTVADSTAAVAYCNHCHSAAPLLDTLPGDTLACGTGASAVLASPVVLAARAARRLEHFSLQCAFAERVSALTLSFGERAGRLWGWVGTAGVRLARSAAALKARRDDGHIAVDSGTGEGDEAGEDDEGGSDGDYYGGDHGGGHGDNNDSDAGDAGVAPASVAGPAPVEHYIGFGSPPGCSAGSDEIATVDGIVGCHWGAQRATARVRTELPAFLPLPPLPR